MKKLALILLAFALAGGTVVAQPEGLYVGGELGYGDLMNSDIKTLDQLVIRVYAGIETTVADDAVDVRAELGVPVLIGDELDLALGVDLNLMGQYNLDMGSGSLGLRLENWTYIPFTKQEFLGDLAAMASTLSGPLVANFNPFAPGFGGLSVGITSFLEFGAKYTMGLDFGSLYFGLDFPLQIVSTEDDNFKMMNTAQLHFTVGAIVLDEALDLGLTLYSLLKNWEEKFEMAFVEVYGDYTMDALTAGLSVWIPIFKDGMKALGLEVDIRAAYDVTENLNVYLEVPISGIGADKDFFGTEMGLGFTLGAKFTF
jgi:hypothetical protein